MTTLGREYLDTAVGRVSKAAKLQKQWH